MVERRKPIAVAEAVSRVQSYRRQLEPEWVSIEECDNRLLAAPVIADHDVPPFDRSPYDGFAIRSEDTIGRTIENPVQLKVIEEIGAGDVASQKIESGVAIRIMTGAQLPDGADAIIMLELVQELKENDQSYIIIKREVKKGDNISRKGEDKKLGTTLVEAGSRITPGIKAVLATFGYSKVQVARRPIVGVLATGSELLGVDEPLVPGKIRNSNAYMVMAQVKKAGGIPVDLGKFVDDLELSYQAVKKAVQNVDLLITTGGVSVGDFDFLPEIYRKLGATVLFNKIGMRPGSVTTCAVFEDKLLFGLSGNPSACFVGFELFAGPYIKALMGQKEPYLYSTQAKLMSDFPKPNPFTRFVRARLDFGQGELKVVPVGLDKSNVVTSLAEANALIVLPGGTRGFSKGDRVTVLMLNGEGAADFELEPLSNRRA